MSRWDRVRRRWAAAWLMAWLAGAPLAGAQTAPGKGHRILLDRGIQLMAVVSRDDPFHVQTLQAAGFTGVCWTWEADHALLGSRPAVAWSQWVRDEKAMPPAQGGPAGSEPVALQFGDEQDLNQPAVRAATADWFARVRDRYPRTLLFCNSYGGQLTNPALEAFITSARPDMLCFDTYPFTPTGPAGSSPAHLYGDLQRYRRFARAHRLPLGMYTQTFHDRVSRDPSESEMRLNYFAGLAFGCTYFAAFTYNTGASALFSGPGDTNPRPALAWLTEIHRRVRALSPALTRLVCNDVCYIPGRHREPGRPEAADNPRPVDVPAWRFGAHDPWLRGWEVKNLGPKNDGLNGDLLLSWFKLLDEGFDGPDYRDEVYFMVTNGLTSPDGSAAECRQEVRLNFLFENAPVTGLQRLNQATGRVEAVELPVLPGTGGRRQLVLTLDGGTGELFKFNTGAPFVGMDLPASRPAGGAHPNGGPAAPSHPDDDDIQQEDFVMAVPSPPVIGGSASGSSASRPADTRPAASQPGGPQKPAGPGTFSPCSANDILLPGC